MRVIAIDPHGDDLSLFGAFHCLQHKPLVLVTHLSVPKGEVRRAMRALGCKWKTWPLEEIDYFKPDLVIAPARLKDGLPEHNHVAAHVSVNYAKRIEYMTYCGHPRQKARAREVEFRPEWLWKKLRALQAFESQARTPSWVHFAEDLREYIA